MNILPLLDIETGVRSFFASLAASLSFNLIFIIGLALEALAIFYFAIRVSFTYEIRATKALDRLNRWLFVNKRITADNIKEFTNLVKKAPRRLAYNWQQFILYREKAPSEYLNVENVVEKPLKTSGFRSSIRNFGIVSFVIALIAFIAGIAHTNVGDTVLNASMVIVSLITPLCIMVLWAFATIIFNGVKGSNLDVLYQNHHLFQRFVDNACVELPPYIDFTLLFTVQEIEKGIPALREFLENRARKEKEEFEKAKNEMVVYEKYDFSKAGVDGSNILERAMNESEAYLNNKNKTLAKITQLEASLESLKKNFDNIQKDYQKKMQVSKENIDRLRQQQEETTSRIESNFLRKQQATEIAKQEREENDFEQQKRRYLVEKGDIEEEIQNLNKELDEGRAVVEKAMLSEYESFYKRLCQKAFDTVDNDIKTELSDVKTEREKTEDELAIVQTKVKRLEDENSTLRNKLGLEPVEEQEVIEETPKQKVQVEAVEEKQEPEEFDFGEEEKREEKVEQPVFTAPETAEEVKQEPVSVRVELEEEPEYDFEEETEPVVTETKPIIQEVQPVVAQRKRGRPVGSTKKKVVEPTKPLRGRGRPRKEQKTEKPAEPKRRGRPVGSKNKVNSPSVKKRAAAKKSASATSSAPKEAKTLRKRGRPRKQDSVRELNNKINREEKKITEARRNVNREINQTLRNINQNDGDAERLRLIKEIENLKQEAARVTDSTPSEEIERLNQKMETLLQKINKLG